MEPIRIPEHFRVIAHRGASGYAPENTRAAFDAAMTLGVYEVELDVQLSTDGVVVVCHDRTLERYGHGPMIVEELPSSRLLSLDMGSWFSPEFAGQSMLTLDGLFSRYSAELAYHVEIKGAHTSLAAETVRIINAHALVDRCVVTSFSRESLNRVQVADPHTPARVARAKSNTRNAGSCPRLELAPALSPGGFDHQGSRVNGQGGCAGGPLLGA